MFFSFPEIDPVSKVCSHETQLASPEISPKEPPQVRDTTNKKLVIALAIIGAVGLLVALMYVTQYAHINEVSLLAGVGIGVMGITLMATLNFRRILFNIKCFIDGKGMTFDVKSLQSEDYWKTLASIHKNSPEVVQKRLSEAVSLGYISKELEEKIVDYMESCTSVTGARFNKMVHMAAHLAGIIEAVGQGHVPKPGHVLVNKA